MNIQDFEFVRKLVKERSGLVLTPDKGYLLESRLMPVARRRKLDGISALVAAAQAGDEVLVQEITEAMTTNESFFFRDIKPFDLFRDVTLPHLLKNRADKKYFRIWCAAASNGQEPYSLAIVLKEQAAKLVGWRYQILGTDIATEVLEKAKTGLYTQFEIQRGMPVEYLVKYCEKVGERWKIAPALSAVVEFRKFNLLSSLKPLGRFDVVFCRNVLIYFDEPTKRRVLDEISAILAPDGFLFLGGAETVIGINDKFKPMEGQRGVYGHAKKDVTLPPPTPLPALAGVGSAP